MAGQKFQYDESGGTFFYFLLSFSALVLIPTTIYFWPRKKKENPEKLKTQCNCTGCVSKRIQLSITEPYKNVRGILIRVGLILGWLLLAYLTYRVSQFDYEMASFDPYEILNVPPGASQADIKKAYRKLSVILHPDKETGDEKAFMKLSKAYQALTDDEARKNWEKYGNPDGPGAMSFGIALPSWIVEKENSIWVLGLYALVFMVALPVGVGTWWYRQIKFSGDKVLLDTTQLYFYFFHKTPHMAMKRVIMILAASYEFNKRHNSQVIERPSDNEEVPSLIKQLPNLNEKCKELPLSRMYSVKARAIIHAHLTRMKLNPETLEVDRRLIVKKCPYLIQEMVSCVHQLIMLAYARRVAKLPAIETIENCMKLSPMVIQGLWDVKSPLLQLPYVTEDHLRLFNTKKRHIKNLQQFAQLKPEESRYILKYLSDEEYNNVMKALSKMPLIDFSIRCEVIDDEDSNVVTAGAIVTVTVSLKRRNMSVLFGDQNFIEKEPIKESDDIPLEGNENTELLEEENGGAGENQVQQITSKKPVWMKPQKKGHKSGGGKKSGNKKVQKQKVVPKQTQQLEVAANTVTKSKANLSGDESGEESEFDEDGERSSSDEKKKNSSNDEDDVEWNRFQQKINKKEKLEGVSKVSHSVHCPYFPEDKQEYWWTYICDRKSRTLLTVPYHVTNLVDSCEVQLKFTAPRWPNVYVFTVCLRSDSYLGMDQQQELKLDVKEAAAIPTEHPQWDISDTESEKEEIGGNESEFTTDSGEDDEE